MIARALAGLFIFLPLATVAAFAAADSRDRIVADWETNRKRFNSVRYKLSGTLDMKDPTAGGSPAQKQKSIAPSVQPVTATVTLDVANKRFRIESSRPRPSLADRKKWVPDFKVVAYNGKAQQTYLPRDKNERPEGEPDLGISTGDLNQLRVDASYWPLFAAHGFVPTRSRLMYPDNLPHDHDPDDFVDQGGGVQAGRKCRIIRSEEVKPGPTELWVDVERGSSIVRRIDFNAGNNPFYRFDVEHQAAEGAWLPKRWTLTYSMDHRVWQLEKLEVTSFELNPAVDDNTFTIPITPGMLVRENKYPPRGAGLDPERPALRNSRAGEGGRLTTISETGFTTTDGVQLLPERSWDAQWWVWAAGAVAVLVVAVVGYRLMRGRSPVAPVVGSSPR